MDGTLVGTFPSTPKAHQAYEKNHHILAKLRRSFSCPWMQINANEFTFKKLFSPPNCFYLLPNVLAENIRPSLGQM